MEPTRELGKILLILGDGDCGGGDFLAGRAPVAGPFRKIARRHFVSWAEYKFLFSDCDVHRVERCFDFAPLGCGVTPQMKTGRAIREGDE